MQLLQDIAAGSIVAIIVLASLAAIAWGFFRWKHQDSLTRSFQYFFAPTPASQLTVTGRVFPTHIRADLQLALEEFANAAKVHLFEGLQGDGLGYSGIELSSIIDQRPFANLSSVRRSPPEYEQFDIGEPEPLQVLKNGLWLLEFHGEKLALLSSPFVEIGGCGLTSKVRVQIAAVGKSTVASELFDRIEQTVKRSRSYRGKILSLEESSEYSGESTGIRVHRLEPVRGDGLILEDCTLDLLKRNVIDFVKHRNAFRDYEMSTKKGLLFYGPPGTGKTMTIRYLAGELKDHTTLLISAEQVELLGEYMVLARLLQPTMVVIEDVDLIARERTSSRNRRSEVLLNKLLNEMDGLREDSDILFILTTNRPEGLEMALASRPGRIDQAIEFPLPDRACRHRLVHVYGRCLDISDDVVDLIVSRTESVSASFIKELMRRAAQFQIGSDKSSSLSRENAESALRDMLESGGPLNRRILGAGPCAAEDEADS